MSCKAGRGPPGPKKSDEESGEPVPSMQSLPT